MKLDHNRDPHQVGKYAILKMRRIEEIKAGPFQDMPAEITAALQLLIAKGIVEIGDNPATEFFVIRLKDKYAEAALNAYGNAAALDDMEYAMEIFGLAARSGPNHPLCKKPD